MSWKDFLKLKKNLLKFLEFVFASKQTNVANKNRIFSASSFKHNKVKL